MNLNVNLRVVCVLAFLAAQLSSCAPQSVLLTPTITTIPPKPTNTKIVATPTAPATESAHQTTLMEAGVRHSDTSEDMEIPFLDVLAFEATVDEETETLIVVFQMRDIPPTAPQRQILNFVEYWWQVSVYLEAPTSNPADEPGDYNFAVLTSKDDPSTSANVGIRTPVPGERVDVPFDQLWDDSSIYNSSGETVSTLEVVADSDSDTLTLTGHVPGITSRSLFDFSTFYLDGSMDRQDNYVPPSPTESNQTAEVTLLAYPGPQHYTGDVLTFEIQGGLDGSSNSVTITLDGQDAITLDGQWLSHDKLLLPLAFNTSDLVGAHTLNFSMENGDIEFTYSFNLLPADQRPANEDAAEWRIKEVDCCLLHYISRTAAARDIEFIAENFEKGAEQILTIHGKTISPKMDVYILDRMWGNGGFGGNGELVISYTDRYYGPTIGALGLQTLARHEFTHAAGVGFEEAGDGIEFNSEGLAVYIAGGHYKPEPLAERGAALYDLGYYVPVGQFIGQHELDYLYSAAMLTYIKETYGTETLWILLAADENPQDGLPTPFDRAIQSTLGISLSQFDQNFEAWLESLDPHEQLEDLRLTIELQDLRRTYQETYSPPPSFIAGEAADAVARPEYLPVIIREANLPFNVATELIIADGQRAIFNGDYKTAQLLILVLKDVLTSGKFNDPLAMEYWEIVNLLSEAGYEVISLDLQENEATIEVTMNPPHLTSLEIQKVNGVWQIIP